MVFDRLFALGAAKPNLAGISFGANTMRWVEIAGSSSRPVVSNLALHSYSADLIEDGIYIKEVSEIAQALMELQSKAKSKTRRVALTLPSNAVITRRISVPRGLSNQELIDEVEKLCAEHIPYPVAEVVIDWVEMSPTSKRRDKELLVGATKRETVEDFQVALELAGLEAIVLTDQAQVKAHLLDYLSAKKFQKPAQKKYAYFQVDMNGSVDAHIIEDRWPVHSAHIPATDGGLFSNIATRYGCSLDEARTLYAAKQLNQTVLDETIQPFIQRVSMAMAQELADHVKRSAHPPLNIYLCGAAASISGLVEHLRSLVPIPCEVLDPFRGFDTANSGIREQLTNSDVAMGYDTALGLATMASWG